MSKKIIILLNNTIINCIISFFKITIKLKIYILFFIIKKLLKFVTIYISIKLFINIKFIYIKS